MIPQSVFKKHGCDTESLRALFTISEDQITPAKDKKGVKVPPRKTSDETTTGEKPGVYRLRQLLRSRLQDGAQNNLRDYRIFAAIDYAYDAPFHQTTPTLVQHILHQKMTYEESLKVVEGWGLVWSDIFRLERGPDGAVLKDDKGCNRFVVNAPSLVRTLIPLVKSLVTVRTAKLYTDRDQIPLFKFEPIHATDENRLLCEVLTSIAEAMVTQFGYRSELKDLILHTLLYGICLMFPQEAWFCEKQENVDGEDQIVKEGLRYLQPHPTRFFYDLMYRTSSFNTNTGCKFAGHWRIIRYGDILHNPNYFNKGAISYGTNWFNNPLAGNYFSDFYPCTVQFPQCAPGSDTNREDRAAFYCVDDEDKAVFQADMLCELIPSQWDLGTYTHPVWFRFVMASDDTVIFAEPLSYNPIIYSGYDADGNRVRNASMALELIPFQDQLGNILSQILLTAKQNLANITFYDKNIVNAAQIETLKNSGEMLVRALNFVEMDKEKDAIAGLDTRKAFETVNFAKMSTAELTNTMNTIISMAERMLSFSAQELGGAASHQQSAEEIRTVAGNVGVRVAYTGTFVDDAIDAWKTQIANASMAYMDSGFIALVSPDIPNLDELLKKLGFEMVERGGGRVKTKVRVDKKKIVPLLLEGLASTRDGPDRGTDAQAATVQMQTWSAIAANQPLAQAVGAKTILRGMEEAARLGGAGKDFKLEAEGEQQNAEQLVQVAQQIQQSAVQESVQQVTKLVAEQVVKPAAEQIAKQQDQIGQLAQEVNAVAQGSAATQVAVDKLTQIVQVAMSASPLPPVQPPMPTPYGTEPLPPVGGQPVAGPGPVIPPQVAVPI